MQKVGDAFLSGCSSLKEVNISPLSNVQEVGGGFLFGCSSLKEVDLRSLCKVQKVGDHFLGGCSSLATVIMPGSPTGSLIRAIHGLLEGSDQSPAPAGSIALMRK